MNQCIFKILKVFGTLSVSSVCMFINVGTISFIPPVYTVPPIFGTEQMKKSRCWALPGNTHLLSLHDNQFTWQHRAKNIQTPLKITESKEKRGGSCALTPISPSLEMAQQRWDRIKGAREEKKYSVCFDASQAGESKIHR